MSTGSNPEHDAVMAPGQEQSEKAPKQQRRMPSRKPSAPRPSDEIEGKRSPMSELQRLDQQSLKRKTIVVGILLVLVSMFGLCVDKYYGEVVSPAVLLDVYGLFFGQIMANITHSADIMTSSQLLEANKHYFTLLNNTGVIFITALGGMLLSLAGTLYQNVFRNPIASPTMLGVSSGIQVSLLILVLIFGSAAPAMAGFRYLISYGFVVITLIALFGFSKMISGPGRPLNVINMLLVGTILSQLYGVVTTYVTWNVFTDEQWTIYNSLSEVLAVDTAWYAYVFIIGMTIVSVGPILMLRFRLNVLSFSETEMKGLGVNADRLQVIALTCATLMMVAAQVSVGTVAMISLVVPHVSRFLFGAEFRKQFIGNILLGALLLVVCRCITPFIPFVGGFLPIGTVVSFVVMPVFVWMIATQQRTWE